MRPLFGWHMRATNVQKAFALNSIFLAVVTAFTFAIHDSMSRLHYFGSMEHGSGWKDLLLKMRFYAILVACTFTIGMVTYGLLFVLFGFGGGMLAVSKSWLIQRKGKTSLITKVLYATRHKKKMAKKRRNSK
jgi:hypothetical protein